MRELGLYAYEKRMPSWLETLLRKEQGTWKEGKAPFINIYLHNLHCDRQVF